MPGKLYIKCVGKLLRDGFESLDSKVFSTHGLVYNLVNIFQLARESRAFEFVPRLELGGLQEAFEGNHLVLVLVALLAGFRPGTRGFVDDADPGLDLVDVLATFATATKGLNLEVFLREREQEFLSH